MPEHIKTEKYAVILDNLFAIGAPFTVSNLEINATFSQHKIGMSKILQKETIRGLKYATYYQVWPN